MEFKVGDKVVYPNHGIGVIEDVQTKTVLGDEQRCYMLKILANASTVTVPVDNTDAVGLRPVLARKGVTTVLERLKTTGVAVHGDWKGRYQENSDKMRSGLVEEVVDVLKSLTVLSSQKPLSYRERKMLDRARFLVISELAEASQQSVEKIETQVDQTLSVSMGDSADH